MIKSKDQEQKIVKSKSMIIAYILFFTFGGHLLYLRKYKIIFLRFCVIAFLVVFSIANSSSREIPSYVDYYYTAFVVWLLSDVIMIPFWTKGLSKLRAFVRMEDHLP